MYRYSVDNAITYTSEDLVLFKESPFACWMERLTLENPNHGIPPDADAQAPRDSMESQDDLADTLRAEGKQVVLVEWESAEPLRRAATLDAMRHGVDFIVNGQLALGALSGSANLLMRTSGYSDLGDYLYVPCNTQRIMTLHSALRLCFLADLLHSLQGQLPPQMLIIRGGSDVVPLQTEDHIYHYRAVKARFMKEQQAFRKHRMPDPAESSHFGRWADCANEVIKQRALRGEDDNPVAAEDEPMIYASRHNAGSATAYDLDEVHHRLADAPPRPMRPATGGTLAEQARSMAPGAQDPEHAAPEPVDTLEKLAFIGSSSQAPTIGQSAMTGALTGRLAPPASLRSRIYGDSPSAIQHRRMSGTQQFSRPPEESPSGDQAGAEPNLASKPHPLDSPGFQRDRQGREPSSVGSSREVSPDIPAPVLPGLHGAAPDKDANLGRLRSESLDGSLRTGYEFDND